MDWTIRKIAAVFSDQVNAWADPGSTSTNESIQVILFCRRTLLT